MTPAEYERGNEWVRTTSEGKRLMELGRLLHTLNHIKYNILKDDEEELVLIEKAIPLLEEGFAIATKAYAERNLPVEYDPMNLLKAKERCDKRIAELKKNIERKGLHS